MTVSCLQGKSDFRALLPGFNPQKVLWPWVSHFLSPSPVILKLEMKIGDFVETINTQMNLFGTVPSTLCTLHPVTGSVTEIRQCLEDKE